MSLLTELVAFLRYCCYKDFAPTELRISSAESIAERTFTDVTPPFAPDHSRSFAVDWILLVVADQSAA
jgi:hypothetical protein